MDLPADNRRAGRIVRCAVVIVASLGAAWLLGLLLFAGAMPAQSADSGPETDAIVVLTGGEGRLEAGLRLLNSHAGTQLFISGVNRDVDVPTMLRRLGYGAGLLECCISVGHAHNTRGNANETALWMRERGFSSLRLVTASYHMARSLIEFRRTMPSATIISHPVVPRRFRQSRWWAWPGSRQLTISEYNKFLAALVHLGAYRIWSAVGP